MPVTRITIVLALLLSSAPAFAQSTPPERVAITLGAAYPASTTTFTQTTSFEAYAETGSLTTTYAIPQKVRFDVAGVVRLWHGLGVGIAASTLDGTAPAAITGQIPHPINVNQPRALTGTADAWHSESAIHLQAAYWFRVTPRIDIIVTGGPSRIKVQQDFVSDVSYSQTFPYDTVTFESATLTREEKTVTGANVGADVGVRLLAHIGAAGFVRYSRATADFPDSGVAAFRVGTFDVGGGIRLAF